MSVLASLGAASARLADLPSWLIGLLVALIGASGATWYYRGSFSWWHVIFYLAVASAALAIGWIGERRLATDPVTGVKMIGARTLATLMVAGLAAVLLIAVAIEIVPEGKSPSGESKELFGAFSAAIAAAITGSLIKVTEAIDGPAARMAESGLKKAFASVDPNSTAGKALHLDGYAGKWGWGPSERVWRAEQVAAS
jgi:succinate dehydrogenase hydrophobic anchor subunit